MVRTLITIFIICWANPSVAQTCPDFYRFVEFGRLGADNVLYRGGPTFRAEGFEGQLLLDPEKTRCLPIKNVTEDGHGNPIPIVTQIDYIPAETGLELKTLRLVQANKAGELAEQNATRHRTWLTAAGSQILRGAQSLCARPKGISLISCQVVSPFENEAPLVVYCDNGSCDMPTLVIDDRIIIAATWETSVINVNVAGDDISMMVQQIHTFLDDLTTSF